jgi:hypothetical protein
MRHIVRQTVQFVKPREGIPAMLIEEGDKYRAIPLPELPSQ